MGQFRIRQLFHWGTPDGFVGDVYSGDTIPTSSHGWKNRFLVSQTLYLNI